MASALTATPDVQRGLVRLAASGVPAGNVIVTRSMPRTAPVTIRGGTFPVITGGFLRTDSEPMFGSDLTYRVVDTVTSRVIQTNRVLNPKFATNLANWTIASGRTSAQETAPLLAPPRDAVTSLRIGPRTAGPGANTLTERFLASCSPSGFTAGRWYVSGQVRYDSPDIWIWDDVKTAGTWQTIKNKGTWQDVKASNSPLAGQPFASLWAAVLGPTGTQIVAPVQVLGIQTGDNGGWATFQAYIDIPAGSPANCQLAFYQGSVTREYNVTWWLSTLMVTPNAEAIGLGAVLPYFDGDSVVPANPAENLAPGYGWQALTGDAAMVWTGTANGSWSQFTGPSQIFTETAVTIGRPDTSLLPRTKLPVFLSDPVVPQLAQWFELVEVGDLTFAARQQLFDVLGRAAQIAVSQLRSWPSGEIRLMTYTDDERQVAERMFATGRILYWRNPDPRFPENGWYIGIGDVSQGRVGAGVAWSPERLWKIPFVKVERPEGLIAASSSIDWAAVKAGYSWAELRQERADWLDVALTGPST